MTQINHTQQKGFALLITLMMVGVVLSVTLAIVELSLKQLKLSVDSRESEVAFQAANAGLECAQRIRRTASTTIEAGNNVTFDCFEKTSTASKESSLGFSTTGVTANGNVYRYKTLITWGSNNDRCSEIDIVAMVTNNGATGPITIGGTGNNSLKKVFLGYESDTKTCPQGGVCTLASVKGFSSPCSTKDATDTLMRRILLEF